MKIIKKMVLNNNNNKNHNKTLIKSLSTNLTNNEIPKNTTFSRQNEIPKLVVPEPKDTFKKYLKTIEPYMKNKNDDKLRIEKQINDFLNSDDINKRQNKLKELENNNTSWLEDLWINGAYLSWRAGLLINSNVVGYLIDDDRKNYNQTFAAAGITVGMLNYHLGLLHGTIPIDMNRDKPQCMHTYNSMFSLNREPGIEIDKLVKYQPHESDHIIVTCGYRFYKIPNVLKSNGTELNITIEELQSIFNNIKKESHKLNNDSYPIGVLTGCERTFWANSRNKILELSNNNKNILKDIESALFVVSIEKGICRTNGQVARDTLHGDGRNRWFDKSFNLIIKEDGDVSILVEHSWADAPVPLSGFFNHALPYLEANEKYETDINNKNFNNKNYQHLKFDLNDDIKNDIREAEIFIDETINESDTKVEWCYGLGKPIWKQAKLSPDAAVQMAMQLAYRRLHGPENFPIATYETIGMAGRLHGRTEACRVVSSESTDFVNEVVNNYLISKSETDRKKAEEKLRIACKAHINYIIEGQQCKGIDRHMLGLRLMSEDGNQPDLFKDPLFDQSGSTGGFVLSTSNNSYIPRPFGGMFGTVMPNGYGVCYIPRDKGVLLCVESKKSSKQSDSSKFIEMVNESLIDVAKICGVKFPQSKL